jgi:uridine kinase
MPTRTHILRDIADSITALPGDRIIRVAVDGVDGAGKTIFADELAEALAGSGRPAIRASVDSFHNPRAVRYRRGERSPLGFFLDSYNYPLLKSTLLDPLSPGGNGAYRAAAFDHTTDRAVSAPLEHARADSILVFDGIFLHRPELRLYWDYSIFLEVGFDISIPRGAARGSGSPDPAAPSNTRYVEGQRIYLRECDPTSHATVVVNNEDLENPFIVPRINRGEHP